MVQVWVIRADMSPVDAVLRAEDGSICGTCPHRNARGGFTGRSCYVRVHNAPMSVWDAYRRGRYRFVGPEAFERQGIRWGAYGDPALLPESLVKACNHRARFWTGYTHLHRQPWAQWARGVFMASVETETQETAMRREGWGTFRVGRRDGSDRGVATVCANEATGPSCSECKLCNGAGRAIVVSAHGPQAGFVPAERLLVRRRAGASCERVAG